MKHRWLSWGSAALLLMGIVIGSVGGVFLERRLLSSRSATVQVPQDAGDPFRLMAEVWGLIDRYYVNQEEVQPQQMSYGAARGMVQTLKDAGHTRFLTPNLHQQHQTQIEGEFEGIGVYAEMRAGRVVIVAPIDDSPAQAAGLQPGDVILKVNGRDLEGLTLTEITDRILGPAGSEVTLTIQDAHTGERQSVTLERAEVDIDLVSWQQLPGTEAAYVRITSFSKGTVEELQHTLDEILAAEGVDGMVLDLRNNPGGLLDQAIGTASYFVDSGVILKRRNAQGELIEEQAWEDVEAVEIPVVVLANAGSASSAEVVIGALQDHYRATVVGVTTFGAGTVLNEFELPEGAVLLLAVEEWLTPEGRVIWREGLEPDLQVKLPEGAAPLRRFQLEDLTAEALMDSQDEQLLRALALLADEDSP